MSGGYFDYWQYHIGRIADDVEQLILNNNDTTPNEWGGTRGHHYQQHTIDEFKRALQSLRQAAIYAQRIDWLVCGDDGEETFHARLRAELQELNDKDA
jgi:hypothetical protein